MRIIKICKKWILIFSFLIIIFGIAIFNILNFFDVSKNTIITALDSKTFDSETFEQSYNDNFNGRLNWVNINSLAARIMDQKITNGVIKGDNGKLNFIWATEYKFEEEKEKEKVAKAISILEYAKESGAKTLYVQRPWAISELPYGYKFEQDRQYNYWCEKISEGGIPVLDFREELKDKIEFYTTDHHWTVKSSFFGAKSIIDELSNIYNINLDSENTYLNLENYHSKNFKNSFLGAEGIRAGKYFAGQDDFEVLYPRFNTDFDFRQLSDKEEYFNISGDFKEVFIDWKILNDDTYNNKYNALSYGAYNENIIVNKSTTDNNKVLLIADSFGRPMVSFMSLCFKEVRYLDPQEGRYTDSYVEYIKEYDPDIVIMMFPGDGLFQNI